MSRIVVQSTRRLKELFTDGGAVEAQIGRLATEAGIDLPASCNLQVLEYNISPELAEKTGLTHEASLHLYCERIENRLREKFRTFSGTLHMVAEVRMTQDRADWIGPLMQIHVDAVIAVLDANRGCWGQGMLFNGGYDVVYGAVRQGGRRVNQAAKISFAVETSTD